MKNGTRTLLIDYMLKRLTDEENYLSREDFIDKIEAIGGDKPSSNTIKADLDAIEEFNAILKEQYQNIINDNTYKISGSISFENVKKLGSHITSSVFSEGELIILFKFIENCFYLDIKEKESLMQKVLLHSSLLMIDKYNLNNGFDESTHYNPSSGSLIGINTIQRAIVGDKCLKFKYFTYIVKNKTFERVESQHFYTVYPIRFKMEGNYLYVIGYDLTEYNQEFIKDTSRQLRVKHYRVDRITKLQTMQHKLKCIEDFLSETIIQDAKEQVDNTINGFGGEEYIELKIKINIEEGIEKSPFKTFVDRFGRYVINIDKHDSYLIMTIKNVLNGTGLIHYLFGFDKQIEVIAPVGLRKQMIEIIDQMKNTYE